MGIFIFISCLIFSAGLFSCNAFSLSNGLHTTMQQPLITGRKRNSMLLASAQQKMTAESPSSASHDLSQGSSVATSSFNLAKSIIGAGVLSLPSGVALFSDQPEALLPSAIACGIFGIMAAYSFSIIGRVCEHHRVNTFQDAWAKSISVKSSWIVSSIVMSLCFLGSLAYSIIIGDSFTSLFQVFLLNAMLSSFCKDSSRRFRFPILMNFVVCRHSMRLSSSPKGLMSSCYFRRRCYCRYVFCVI
jgi:hypothetical protein